MIDSKDGSRPMRQKTIMKRLLCLLAALALCLPAWSACAETKSEWSYRFEILEDGTATIVDFRGAGSEVSVPEEIEGYPITAIGSKAFHQSFNLEKIFIPSGVVSIGPQAFSSCSSLREVTLPNTLKSIGNKAFSNCKSLTSLVLPELIFFQYY